jgi:hypothetical protein
MKRRRFVARSFAIGTQVTLMAMTAGCRQETAMEDATPIAETAVDHATPTVSPSIDYRLTPPDRGKILVAFPISPGVTVIDFAGPWEVFQDVQRCRPGDRDLHGVPGCRVDAIRRDNPGWSFITDTLSANRAAQLL